MALNIKKVTLYNSRLHKTTFLYENYLVLFHFLQEMRWAIKVPRWAVIGFCRTSLAFYWVLFFPYNFRLDMCRRQFPNDACNRGTAGRRVTEILHFPKARLFHQSPSPICSRIYTMNPYSTWIYLYPIPCCHIRTLWIIFCLFCNYFLLDTL